MRKFDSVQPFDRVSLSPRRHSSRPTLGAGGEPPPDAPRFGEVMFEIGLILAVHLGIGVMVTLLLRGCTSC
jgi:hypothetical protein